MAKFDLTKADPILKTKFTDQKIQEMVYPLDPFFALVRKNTKATGRNIQVPILISDAQGVSNSVSVASDSTYRAGSEYAAFYLTRAKKYGWATVDGETLAACSDDAGAAIRAIENESRRIVHNLGLSASIDIWRNGGGAIGKIASGSGTTTITLTNKEDIVHFSKNMYVQTSTADGTSGSAKAGMIPIVALDRDAGTLTTTGNWSSYTGTPADNDYIFRAGNFGSSIKGVAAWVPSSAPGATAFFGVDRSVDTVALGGIRSDVTGDTILGGFITTLAKCQRQGATPTHAFMNPTDYAKFLKYLEAKTIQAKTTSVPTKVASVSFEGVQVLGPTGPVTVLASRFVPVGYTYILQLDTWTLFSIGEVPTMLSGDGLKDRAEASDDAYTRRWGMYYQLGCNAPGYNAVMTGY